MLTVRNIKKEYRTGNLVQKALDGVSLSFRECEFVAILGISGSGKTSLLNVIGGLDRYDSGEMTFRGVPTSTYKDRDWDTYRNHTIGFIFQSYNLIPHQTILSNVELAMTLSGVSHQERRQRAQEALERVGLLEQAHKKHSQLSGGQMQRVAIARALVNNPSVLLADEPTGALDSETGEQVMQLLQEVAKDHLVIMVTHNPDLANRYATRIVRLHDGKVTEDSDPYSPEDDPKTALSDHPQQSGKRLRKPSMSFLTALSLSVANLLNKKARTALVAFAASIGIVGIALILSLSNGANAYIRQMERDSLSQYPIEILSSAFSMEETMMSFAAMRNQAATPANGDQVTEQQMMGGMLSSARLNDLKALKRWLDSGLSGLEEVTRGVDYRYGISPQIYQLRGDGYAQVNPDQTMSVFGISTNDGLTGTMAGYGMNEIFRPLPENEALYRDDYTLLAGHWPSKDTDCVLVLTGSGGIPDVMLYTMGIKDADELNSQIESVVAGSGSTMKLEKNRVFDADEFLGISFRLLPAYENYTFDETLGVWVDRSSDREQMLTLLQQAEEMQIVGVVKPTEGVSFGILEIGIEYPSALLNRLMEQAEHSDLVKAQQETPDTDILTGIRFGETNEEDFSLMDMVSIHPEHLADAVSIRWDQLDTLETAETRLTTQRTVRILRELSRTGSSQTLKDMISATLPLLMDLIEVDEERMQDVISLNMNEAHMQEMFAARASSLSATYSGNLENDGEPSVYPGKESGGEG